MTILRSALHHLCRSFANFYVVVCSAGGRAEPAVRDIIVMSTMTTITEVVIVHHVGKHKYSRRCKQ